MSTSPLNLGLADLRPMSRSLTIIPRTSTASRASSRRNSLKSDSASSVQSVADESLTLVDIEVMLSQKVHGRKDDLAAAFRTFDQDSSGSVTKGEFRRVVEGFLVTLTQSQFNALLTKVPRKRNGTIPYMEFLEQYCEVSSTPFRISSGNSRNQSFLLGDIQCRLKDKIGGNLKNITRAFRLFDYNRDGQIQHHELRRVLESYCFLLSQQEFHRLWSHYSPNNSRTISYKDFLERLGIDCENYRKIPPESAKLALNWDTVNRFKARPRSRTIAWTVSPETENTMDEIHAKFLKKLSVNHSLVEKALQAFDATDSGFVSHDDLKSVLSSFLFPVSDSTYTRLMSRFGLNLLKPVERRKFISLFKEEEQILPAGKNASPANPALSSIEQVLPKLQEQITENYSLLRRAFLVFDEDRTGTISTGDMRRVLEDMTFSLTDEQFRGLIELLHLPKSGGVNYQHMIDFFYQRKSDMQNQNDSSNGTQPSPSAIKAWPAVEGLLKEKLSDQYDTLMASLKQSDVTQSSTLPPEDLRKLVQQYGLTLSDSHFDKLCEAFMESGAVNYIQMLTSLGILKNNVEQTGSPKGLTERSEKTDMLSVKKQPVVVVVLRRIRDRLQNRGITLQHCLTDISRNSGAVLSLRDFQKILDDCRICLSGPQFQTLIQCLGFHDGEISFEDFAAKYEAVISEEGDEEWKTNFKNVTDMGFMTAEDCLNQLESKIKEHHGDILAAFRLMDRNRDGLVSQNDFKVLFDNLMFVMEENEYQKLLELLGFESGSTISYAEFFRKIQATGYTRAEPNSNMMDRSDQILDQTCEQVHSYLVGSACKGWSEFSKDFCQYSVGGEKIITKKDLHHLLCKYHSPITPQEFEKIWARYDEDGKDHITQAVFLEKLNITPKNLTQIELPVDQSMDRESCMTPITETTLNKLRDWLKLSFEDVSKSLFALDKRRDGHVTVTDLLSLLCQHGFQIEESTLQSLIKKLQIDVCQNKVSYLDFLKHLIGPSAESRSTIASSVRSSMGSPAPQGSVSPVPEEISFDRALQQIQEQVTTNSDMLSKAFTAFDTAGTGLTSQSDFRHVVDHFCVKLTNVQFKRLLAKLSVLEGKETMVDWKKFLKKFDLRIPETSEEWLEKVQKARFPNQARPLPISDVLKRIQEVVSARLYSITKEMVDLDYAGINTISKEDFKGICDHHFMRLTDDQFEKLWKVVPVNAFGRLDYREFLKKFGGQVQDTPSPSPHPVLPSEHSPDILLQQRPKTASCITERSKSEQHKRPSSASGRTTATWLSDSEAVERRLRSQIHNCWMEVQRRCRRADNLRSGEIDVKVFLDILKDFHIDLTHTQFEDLTEKYNIRNNGRLSYPEFLHHFVLTLKPQVQTCTARRKLHTPHTPMSSGPLSMYCKEALLRLCSPVQRSWRPMRRAFVSHDKERTGKISLQDFRKVLRQYNINLSEDDFFHLASFFDKNISGHISYNDFLHIFQK